MVCLSRLPAWRVLAQHRRRLPLMRRRTLHEHVQEHCMRLLRHWDLCRSGGHRVHRLLGREGLPCGGRTGMLLLWPREVFGRTTTAAVAHQAGPMATRARQSASFAPRGKFTLDSDATACNNGSPGKFCPGTEASPASHAMQRVTSQGQAPASRPREHLVMSIEALEVSVRGLRSPDVRCRSLRGGGLSADFMTYVDEASWWLRRCDLSADLRMYVGAVLSRTEVSRRTPMPPLRGLRSFRGPHDVRR